MPNATPMIQMTDEFYQEYRIPNLPLPMSVERLTASLGNDSLSCAVIADNLADYLADNPDEVSRYSQIIARMAYQAGVAEGQQEKHEDAGYYFTMAKQYEPYNVDIVAALAMSYLNTHNYSRAIQEYESVVGMMRSYAFSAQVWLTLANLYFNTGDLRNGRRVVEDYFAQAGAMPPDQCKELVEQGYQLCQQHGSNPTMTQMFAAKSSLL